MYDEKKTVQNPHNLILNGRKNLSLTGVEEVIGCDEELLTVKTTMGELTVSGVRLHIGSFNRNTGELSIDGSIREMIYSEKELVRQGFFKRLFR